MLLYEEDVDASQTDALGRIRYVSEQSGAAGATTVRTRGYEYDAVGRLEYVFENGAQVRQYTYDSNGNRTGLVTPAGMVVGTYDDQDRLTRYCPESGGAAQPTGGLPSFDYVYDDSGQLLNRTDIGSGEVRVFDYDEFGGLRGVTSNFGLDISYELDPLGRRVGKPVAGTPVNGWLYQDALNPVAELDSSGNVVSTFVYATKPHAPDYMVKGGNTYRLVTDHLGSVRMVVDVGDGSVAQVLEYDEFGNVLLDTNPGFQPFGFAGGLYDPDGLVRFGARDYDPVVGRWTSKDIALFADGTNVYTYAGNDPINFIDPTGLYTEVVVWDPAGGIGSSSFGHVSVNVNGTAYSFGPGGLTVEPSADYQARNLWRNGTGYELNLTPEQEAQLVNDLMNPGDYNPLINNCGTPVQNSLADQDLYTIGDPSSGFYQRSGPATFPSTLAQRLQRYPWVTGTNYYPAILSQP